MRHRVAVVALLATATLWSGGASGAQEPPYSQVLEPGFEVALFVGGIAAPTAIDFGPDDHLYVVTIDGNVYRVRAAGTGSGAPPELVVTGLSQPTGMAFGADGLLYLPSDDAESSTPEQPRSMVLAFDVADAVLPLSLADGQPVLHRVPTGIHPLGGLARGPDDLLYVSVGSASLNGDSAPGEVPETEPLTMGVLRFDPLDASDGPLDAERYRGSGAAPEHPIDVVAHGIHNPADLTFAGGQLYTGSNAPQGQEPLGEDVVIRVRDVARRSLAAGTDLDFGSPGCLWMTGPDGHPRSGTSDYAALPEHEKTCDGREPVLTTVGLHTGPTGIATAPASFGPAADDVFVALWGNLIPTPEAVVAGHKVIRIGVDADGEPHRDADCRVEVEDFLAGGSPIDVAFHGGAMYVADMALGGVLRITVSDVVPATDESPPDPDCATASGGEEGPSLPAPDAPAPGAPLPVTGGGMVVGGLLLLALARTVSGKRAVPRAVTDAVESAGTTTTQTDRS